MRCRVRGEGDVGPAAGRRWLCEGGRSHERGSVTVSRTSDLRCHRCEMVVGARRARVKQGLLRYDHRRGLTRL